MKLLGNLNWTVQKKHIIFPVKISVKRKKYAFEKLKLSLEFGKQTTGKEDITHLDSRKVAKRIIDIYKTIL